MYVGVHVLQNELTHVIVCIVPCCALINVLSLYVDKDSSSWIVVIQLISTSYT